MFTVAYSREEKRLCLPTCYGQPSSPAINVFQMPRTSTKSKQGITLIEPVLSISICSSLEAPAKWLGMLAGNWLARLYWQTVNIAQPFLMAEEFCKLGGLTHIPNPCSVYIFLVLNKNWPHCVGATLEKKNKKHPLRENGYCGSWGNAHTLLIPFSDDVRVKEYLLKKTLGNLESKALFITVSC